MAKNSNLKFFVRQPDGSARFRLQLPKEEADLVEEAAGEINPVYWVHSTTVKAARERVEHMRAQRQQRINVNHLSEENQQ